MEKTPEQILEEIQIKNHPGNYPEYLPETLASEGNSWLTGKTVIFLGSSITMGFAGKGISFVDYMQKKHGFQCVKEAVCGTTLVNDSEDSYIPRMKTIDPKLKADLFVCQLSTNDFQRDKGIVNICGAIEEIIDYARDTWGCPIMFYTNSRYDSTSYADGVKELERIASEKQIGIVDLWNSEEFNDVTKEQLNLYMFDAVHPTMAGYRVWWLPEMEKQILEYVTRG